jgi:hypothetical protein
MALRSPELRWLGALTRPGRLASSQLAALAAAAGRHPRPRRPRPPTPSHPPPQSPPVRIRAATPVGALVLPNGCLCLPDSPSMQVAWRRRV